MAILDGQRLTQKRFLLDYRFWLHVTGWSAFFAAPLILPIPIFEHLPEYYVNYLFITRVIINLILVGIFYLNLLRLTPKLLLNRSLIQFLLYLAVLFSMMILLDNLLLRNIKNDLQMYFSDIVENDLFFRDLNENTIFTSPQFFANLIMFALIILSSSLWAVLTDRMRQQEFSQQMLYEKTSAELAVLRLQISPHFLFNTLNNIRWLTRIKSDLAETSVMELSEILRYMLFQVTHHQVNLHDEIMYLKRYVNLQKLRIHPKAEIDISCVGDHQDVRIEPLLFMPFVENAFKFGLHPDHSPKISIYLSVKDYELLFRCKNQCFELANDEEITGTGQGLLNVKKRLELHYPQTHTLTINHDEHFFSVELKLSLKHE
ncbi:histidine kinase [Dyadobacter sp. CY345]|uniref:sensor histidine kinase n=1 Tax=Dyadobacter sp. CY345 TaxID=2909335 RepID=UPI001F3E7F40|nr:histidine kinase [Dyadobacter sp. CY345]MCF2447405.1 histidine kinase [Dyadobacter sp. CY345]